MASFHSRSSSLPSQSHPTMDDVENHLCRLKSTESASISSVDSLCSKLAILRDLHEGINNMILMPSVQQTLSNEKGESWMSELLESSLVLVDLCGFSRDVIYSTKASVQDLESSIRRKRGETATSDEINAYVESRKKIIKKVNKYIKNLKSFSPLKDDGLHSTAKTMEQTQALDLSVLRSVLVMLVAGEKDRLKNRNWSLFSKFSHDSSRVHSQDQKENYGLGLCSLDLPKSRKNTDNTNVLKQLKASEMTIQEIEEELEAFFNSLVKTRVSLLNILSH